MDMPTKNTPDIDIIEEEDVTIGLESKVLLYNDEWHTFDEVIVQIMKAVGCMFDEARDKAFEVHVKGMAMIFNGKFKDCLRVSSVLEEIALHTQIVT
jgi:ATP-dependent Clp protease adaptor protein ClpS